MADMQILADQKKQPVGESDSSDSDAGLPPPLPIQTRPMGLKLNVAGLGLSTVATGAGGKTAEELADQEVL